MKLIYRFIAHSYNKVVLRGQRSRSKGQGQKVKVVQDYSVGVVLDFLAVNSHFRPFKPLLGVKKWPLGPQFLNWTFCSQLKFQKIFKIGWIIEKLQLKSCFYCWPLQNPYFFKLYTQKLFRSADCVCHYLYKIL